MGIFTRKVKEPRESLAGQLVYKQDITSTVKPISEHNVIKEALKGLVRNNPVRFPSGLGEAHPFDYGNVEKMLKKLGIVEAIVEKHLDFILSGGISISSDSTDAKEFLEKFMKDTQFVHTIRPWLKEGLSKGTGFLELGVDKKTNMIDSMKVLKADYMFIKRDEKGKVLKINQWVRSLKEFRNNSTDLQPFEPADVAVLKINTYGCEAYGTGIVFPLMSNIEALTSSRVNMHVIMERKSNSPYIFLMGNRDKNEFASTGEMEDLGQQLEWLNNKHEWVLSDFVKPMTLDFGSLSEKFQFIIDNDMELLFMAAQIPMSIMGKGNMPEGMADVNLQTWGLRIDSLREDIEKVIEESIFKRILEGQNFVRDEDNPDLIKKKDGEKEEKRKKRGQLFNEQINNAKDLDVVEPEKKEVTIEIVWGSPSSKEKLDRIKMLSELLKNTNLNSAIKLGLEKELAKLFDIPADEVEIANEEQEVRKEEDRQSVKKQSEQTPVVVQKPQFKAKEHFHEHDVEESASAELTVKEWVGFEYKGVTADILTQIEKDPFTKIKGTTKKELSSGLLPTKDIEKVRLSLTEGFEFNSTLGEIRDKIDKRVRFKDRLNVETGKLVTRAKNRAIAIARTETVRMSAIGAQKNYEKNGIERYEWITSFGPRTCPECELLSGNIFKIGKGTMPPLHPLCRCTIAAVSSTKIDTYTEEQ